jgi:hypothetical protein
MYRINWHISLLYVAYARQMSLSVGPRTGMGELIASGAYMLVHTVVLYVSSGRPPGLPVRT